MISTRSMLATMIALVSAFDVAVQQRGAQPPAAPGGRGGGRGGRGAVQIMSLTTTAWPDEAPIPAKYSQTGGEISPPLAWSNVPESTASFALIVHDQNAAAGN